MASNILPEFGRVKVYPTPNYNYRPTGMPISSIVLHATVGEAGPSLSWLVNPKADASTHYLIDRDGIVYQMVAEKHRAWHAGRSSYNGKIDFNSFSIGIEFVNRNDGVDVFGPAQLSAGHDLCAYLIDKYEEITREWIVTHRMISEHLTGKTDPLGFPFEEFVAALYPEVVPE